MKLHTMLISRDLEKTKAFYWKLFKARVIVDYGANITLTGGLAFQTIETWAKFIDKPIDEIKLGGNDVELYFETDALDMYLKIIENEKIELVHPLQIADWGQRSIRVYDPDGYIIELGETMDELVMRFHESGWNVHKIVEKTMMSEAVVKRILKKHGV